MTIFIAVFQAKIVTDFIAVFQANCDKLYCRHNCDKNVKIAVLYVKLYTHRLLYIVSHVISDLLSVDFATYTEIK